MKKLIQSHKTIVLGIYCFLATIFFTKVGYEMIEHKGIQIQVYSGDRLK